MTESARTADSATRTQRNHSWKTTDSHGNSGCLLTGRCVEPGGSGSEVQGDSNSVGEGRAKTRKGVAG